jgi:hypothetical protein
MVYKVYVQIQPDTQRFIDPNVFNAWYGFDKSGIETVPFTWPELRDGEIELTRDALVVGGILPVRTAVERLGGNTPANMDYPDCLWPYLHRGLRRATLQDAHRLCVDDKVEPPVFIKPVTGHKEFDGHTLSRFRDLIRTAAWVTQAPETEVWISEVVEFVTECRYFVSRGKVVGVGFYRGDPLQLPNGSVVAEAVKVYEATGEAPVAYTIDFGVLNTGETALVEVNDGFAFGCYGLSALKHCRMLEDRWCQMLGLPISFR